MTIGMNALYKYLANYAHDIHTLYKFFRYDTISGLEFTAPISQSLSSFKIFLSSYLINSCLCCNDALG